MCFGISRYSGAVLLWGQHMSQEDVARPTWMPEAGMHTAASAPNPIKNCYNDPKRLLLISKSSFAAKKQLVGTETLSSHIGEALKRG